MADGFIELDSMSGGDKIDAESLSVSGTAVFRERIQVTGALEAEVSRVQATPLDPTSMALGTREAMNRLATIVTLHSAVTIDGTPLTDASADQDVEEYREAILYLNLSRSTDPPDKFIVRPEFSDDAGTDFFFDLSQQLEFTDFGPTGIPESGSGLFIGRFKLVGRLFRTTILGENIGASTSITATITAEYIN